MATRVCIYGAPKTGKTRLVAAAARGAPELFGNRVLYVATDPEAEQLSSVLPEDTSQLTVKQLRQPGEYIGKGYDPLRKAMELATSPETQEYDTVIWDTGTATAREFLQFTAQLGFMPADTTAGRFVSGKKGTASYYVNPSRADIGAAQQQMLTLLNNLFAGDFNLIFVCHEKQKTDVKGTVVIGGPETSGSASISAVGSMFSYLLRITNKQTGGKEQYVISDVPVGKWLARCRVPHNEPMGPNVVDDPADWWKSFAEYLNK